MRNRWWLFREALARRLPSKLHLAICPHCRDISWYLDRAEANNRWAEAFRDG